MILMNNQFTVIKAFRDKESGQTYGIGSTYESQDSKRAMELETGGYIAESNSQAAQDAQQTASGQQAAQENAQNLVQAYEQAKKSIEPKTVVNGKVVSLAAAQAAEAFHEAKVNQTGIQEQHNNQTESVPSGQIAQQQTQAAQQQEQMNQQQQSIRQANAQSSQQHLEDALNSQSTQSGFESGAAQMYSQGNQSNQTNQSTSQTNQSSEQQQQSQQAAQAAAARAEQTNPAAAEAEEAANMQKAARTRAAKKENQ
jgi:hypothetical protein